MSDQVREQARLLDDECLDLYERGRYSEALQLALEARRLAEGTLPDDDPEVLRNLHYVAELHQCLGHYREAELLYRDLLERRRAALGNDHEEVADTLNNLAGVLESLSQYDEAEALYHEAAAIYRRVLGEMSASHATCLSNLGVLQHSAGKVEEAEVSTRRALEIREALLGDHVDTAFSLDNLADIIDVQGQHSEAEELYRRAIEIRRSALGSDHPDYAGGLESIATWHERSGNLSEAEHYYRQALEVMTRALGEAHESCARLRRRLGTLYLTIGDLERAEPLLSRSVEISRQTLGEDHIGFAVALNALAMLHQHRRELARAEPLYRQALEIAERVFGGNDRRVAAALGNLGTLYSSMGRFAEAEQLLTRQLETLQALGMDRRPSAASACNNLALVCRARGKLDRAEALLQRAVATLEHLFGDGHPDLAAALGNLARVKATQHQPDEALRLLRRAVDLKDRILSEVLAAASESRRLAFLGKLRHQLRLCLSLAVAQLPRTAEVIGELFDLVLRRKALSIDAAAVQHTAILAGRHPQLQPELRRLLDLRRQIAARSLSGPRPGQQEAYRDELGKLEEQREVLEGRLAASIPEMRLQQRLRTVDRAAVARAMPEDSVLIELVRMRPIDLSASRAAGQDELLPARYLALILHASSPDESDLVDLGPAKRIDEGICRFRGELPGLHHRKRRRNLSARPSGVGSARPAGVALRAMVLDPLLPLLRGKRRLLIAPDGELSRLPFEILPLEGGRFAVDDYRISYADTGRDLLRHGSRPAAAQGEPLVLADPDFDLALTEAASPPLSELQRSRLGRDLERWGSFRRLPGTREEGRRVAELLGVPPLLGCQASKQMLLEARSPRVLHIATHGYYVEHKPPQDVERPFSDDGDGFIESQGRSVLSLELLESPLLRSGLALSGANTCLQEDSDSPLFAAGLLTAEETSGLDLTNTDLVVLSACDTGLGDLHAGEGVFGLRRAVTLAGARALVLSLWKVPDQETQELMVGFYQHLLQGRPAYQALREAQLEIKARRPDPFSWGAFVCIGDPGQ